MADDSFEVRVEERLKIKIGDAKNLPARSHGSMDSRDTYCTVSLDQEEIFRTMTAEKTLNPYFGEEFQFEVPRKFRCVSLYVYDRDKAMKQVKVVGKVSIKKEDLPKYHGMDHWFRIMPVDADSEVQGKVHIEVKLERCSKISNDGLRFPRLLVRIVECSDLAIINGACDPFAVVSLCCNSLGKQETKRTKVRKKTVNPQFDETFTFELYSKMQTAEPTIYNLVEVDVDSVELKVALYHDSGGVSANGVFLGEIKAPLQDILSIRGHDAWYFLQPRDNAKATKTDLGSLRLKIDYTSDYIFSSHYYDPLRDLVLSSTETNPITSSAAYILGEIVPNILDAAQPLVRIFMHHNKMVPFIKALAETEMPTLNDKNTLFRGNTLVSKCMDEFMKLAGHHYLQDTLKATIDQIVTERKPCEICPDKLKDGENLENNMNNLKEYIDRVLNAITNSALVCPADMCEVFSVLKDLATDHFSGDKEVRYSVVSVFIFLRFFAPAILGPKLFGLSTEPVDPQTNRTLTLISKTIQSLGNFVSSKSLHCKEKYMKPVYEAFTMKKYMDALQIFLEIISSLSSSSNPHKVIDTPVVLKEGVMIKRAQGRNLVGLKNFKRRYFCLTTQDFSYSTAKGGSPIWKINLDQILAVEKLQESSFKKKNMFQIVQPKRTLYIQATNCVEEKEWIDILAKVRKSNKQKLTEYHPGAFINEQWQCCKAISKTAPGCEPVSSSGVSANIKVHIDSDREIERIHSLFLTNAEKLERLINACEERAVYAGDTQPICPEFIIEDTKTCFKTLTRIQQCVYELKHRHEQHLRNMYRQTKYGSEQAPIGDDNYLRMAAQNAQNDKSPSFFS